MRMENKVRVAFAISAGVESVGVSITAKAKAGTELDWHGGDRSIDLPSNATS